MVESAAFWGQSVPSRDMSLVDYASSSHDNGPSDSEPKAPTLPPARPPSPPKTRASGSSADKQPETLEKLSDASALLNSPAISFVTGNDHASVVAAAMAESAWRKRGSNGIDSSGSAAATPRAKLPRATLPHSKSVPDTRGGLLLPPQLKGRSNVVTEDIGKLFVSKNPNTVAQTRGHENQS